ncbi:MAG: hypothetical protein V4722_27175 [Bacteroidota bacterium]
MPLFAKNLSVILFSTFVFLLVGCTTTEKIDKAVAVSYANQPLTPKKKQADIITVMSPLIVNEETYSKTELTTKKSLSLLFYWDWKRYFTSSLNPKIAINNFTSAINVQARKNIEKLTGKTITFTINQIPAVFEYKERSQTVFAGLALTWSSINIIGKPHDLSISYNIQSDSAASKTGTITVAYPVESFRFKNFFSTFTNEIGSYLQVYDANIKLMGKQAFEKLAKEL